MRLRVWYQGLCAIASSTDHSGTERMERERIEGKKNGDKRGPLFGVGLLCSLFFPLFLLSSLFAVLAAYRLVRVRYTHRMAHMCALVFSVSFNFIKRNRERWANSSMWRLYHRSHYKSNKKTGYQCQMIGSIVTAMVVLNSRIVPAPCSLLLLFVFLSLLPAFVTLVRSAHYCALRRRRQQL